MALTVSTRLGPYEILAPLDVGAMSARGPASERSETSRERGGGAPRNFLKKTHLAHPGIRRWL